MDAEKFAAFKQEFTDDSIRVAKSLLAMYTKWKAREDEVMGLTPEQVEAMTRATAALDAALELFQ